MHQYPYWWRWIFIKNTLISIVVALKSKIAPADTWCCISWQADPLMRFQAGSRFPHYATLVWITNWTSSRLCLVFSSKATCYQPLSTGSSLPTLVGEWMWTLRRKGVIRPSCVPDGRFCRDPECHKSSCREGGIFTKWCLCILARYAP